ncbi:serine protein kinase RIO [Candidatus Woesearchaeota archaeon]|jgi:RIO kinase 1|nr:MAG: serine protein kinase RIO [Candidatus Woesearchaeota archaeon]
MGKITREKFKTYANVFDEFTRRNIFKLATQGHFEELESSISLGKEANIFTARTKEGELKIVKIYRLENCDFNKMFDYIKYDPRYSSIKKRRREIIFSWAQREFRNLLKAREANVRVPTPHICLHNIIIMDLIGDKRAAPQLKDAIPHDPSAFLQDTINEYRKLLKAGLVHGDLSEFNILNHNEKPVFIDFSQATTIESQNAKELLERDAKNLARFFNKRGVETNQTEIYQAITS